MAFSIVSYNILADPYIKPSLYPNVPPSALDPERRIPALRRRIPALGADVICLQEVEPHAFEIVEAELEPAGYTTFFAQKRAKPEGCATFVNQESFTVRSADTMYFRDGRGAEADSGHVALLLVLQGSDGTIGVANTHLKWDAPGTPREERWGYRQASQLVAHLGSAGPLDIAWIVCGDFNAGPGSDVVAVFKDAGFVDAYRDHERMFTNNSNRKAKRIDYLFHAGSLASRPMALPAIANHTPLPSDLEPSDHLAIGARFERRPISIETPNET